MWVWLLAACDGVVADERPEVDLSAVTDERVQVRPSGRAIPANALRFELVCSETMGLTAHHVHVVDRYGTELPEAISSLTWDQGLRLATVEPTGLVEGERYALRISGLTTAGNAVIPDLQHPFVVGPVDSTAPDGAKVQVRGQPSAGTTNAIAVEFDEPVRMSSVSALTPLLGGSPVAGSWRAEKEGARLVFVPDAPWGAGTVYVSVGAGVEDLAGNDLVNSPSGPLVPSVSIGAASDR